MKNGQRVKSVREIKETRGPGEIIIGKGISGTVLDFYDDMVEIEFDGPYVIKTSEVREMMKGKVIIHFEVIRSRNYLG